MMIFISLLNQTIVVCLKINILFLTCSTNFYTFFRMIPTTILVPTQYTVENNNFNNKKKKTKLNVYMIMHDWNAKLIK